MVVLAVKSGFRGIDTACQPKHYYEPGIGLALETLYNENIIKREDIFLQTKYTPVRGQDPNNIPYDPKFPLRQQVLQSFEVSCKNLKTNYLDSLILHSPLNTIESTMIVWNTFEELYNTGKVHYLGISNTYDLEFLQKLYENAIIKPTFLQNRFYKETNYDINIRNYCINNNIKYQSFWTLTANPNILKR